MIDQFGRNIDYARISLTEACNLHCQYCRPQGKRMPPTNKLLSYEELLRVAELLAELGITKFKITGGEPLVRQGATGFLRQLRSIAQQLTLTTNGTLLGNNLEELVEIGVDCVNVSLDSCLLERYEEITGSRELTKVQEAIFEACRKGLKIKLNCVPLRPFQSEDLKSLVAFAGELNLPLRFIELMPLSCNQGLAGLTGAEIRELFIGLGYRLEACSLELGNGPANYYKSSGLKIPIGFIEPLHGKFCSSCNRLRITSTGFVKPCLYSNNGLDLQALLRGSADDASIKNTLRELILSKPKEHYFEMKPAGFSMNSIGG